MKYKTTHWLPALPAELWFRTVGAAVAFLAAVEAFLRLRAIVLIGSIQHCGAMSYPPVPILQD